MAGACAPIVGRGARDQRRLGGTTEVARPSRPHRPGRHAARSRPGMEGWPVVARPWVRHSRTDLISAMPVFDMLSAMTSWQDRQPLVAPTASAGHAAPLAEARSSDELSVAAAGGTAPLAGRCLATIASSVEIHANRQGRSSSLAFDFGLTVKVPQ